MNKKYFKRILVVSLAVCIGTLYGKRCSLPESINVKAENPIVQTMYTADPSPIVVVFLDRGDPVFFTAVNGPAGAGKSKFLYEYVKGLSANPNWKCLFIQNRKALEIFAGLCEWKYPVNLLWDQLMSLRY
ncbi:MAG: hypothetical protein HFG34_10940 [Eubacterium sp.]|nr:hypothetical protein [Eubacterium sp.]